LAALLLGALFGLHRIAEQDLFQQIAVGRAILSDPFSIGLSTFHHTMPDFAYAADKWLASVIAALFDRIGGEHALMLYQILLAMSVAACCHLMFRSRGVSGSASLIGVSLLLTACAFRLEPRPETISLALLALLIALLRPELEFRRALLLIPLIFLFWVNLHGYFIVGLLALLAATASGFGRYFSVGRRLALFGLSLLACMVHPQGWNALLWPFRQLLILQEHPHLREAIQEFQPSWLLLAGAGAWRWALLALAVAVAILLTLHPVGRRPGLRVTCGLLFALPWILWPPAALAAWPYRLTFALLPAALCELPERIRCRDWLDPLLFAGFALLALPMVRNLSIVPMAALLLLTPAWSRVLKRPALKGSIALLLLMLVGWARVADHIPPGSDRSPGWTGWGIDRGQVPVAAADFIEREELPGPLLNHFDNGGYLLYRFHPERRAFISGNTSMYPPEFFLRFHIEVIGRRADPDHIALRYGVRTALLSHTSPESAILAGKLEKSPAWRLAYLDRAAAVYVRDGDRAALPKVEPPPESGLPRWLLPARRLYPDLNFAFYLRASGRPGLALAEADRLWRIAPDIRLATFTAAAAEESGDLAIALPRLEWALVRAPDDQGIRSWLARALYHEAIAALDGGRINEGRAGLQRARNLTPEEAGPLIALARLEASEGNRSEAERLLREALAMGPKGTAMRLVEQDPLLSPLIPRIDDAQTKILD
jgi:hypothetical protein